MNHLGTVPLRTQRLLLRPFTMGDAQAAYRNWTSDALVTKYLRWPTHASVDVTNRVLSQWIESYAKADYYQWAIVPDALDEPIGTIGVVHQDATLEIAHIGYCIGSRWWRQGYTSEAFMSVIPYLFDEVGFNRIESQHDPENKASGLVMQKCGLSYEGTLRQADRSNRGIVDAAIYSLLRQEYRDRLPQKTEL